MQLEDLQQQWHQLDQKLDQSLALQTQLLRQVGVRPVRSRINRFAVWPAIDLLFGIGVALFAGSVLGDHWSDWHVAFPAAVVLAGAVALAIGSILQLQRISELDWSGPIAEIQRGLERLRALKIRQFKWIILWSPFVGFCAFLIVAHRGVELLSDDRGKLLDRIDPWWIGANYAFGVLFVPAGYYIARALAVRFNRQRWWQAVLDDLSGRSLTTAVRDIEHWASL
jgi:hypothetical protein